MGFRVADRDQRRPSSGQPRSEDSIPGAVKQAPADAEALGAEQLCWLDYVRAKLPRSVFLNRDSLPLVAISLIIAAYKVDHRVLPPGDFQ